MGLSVGDDTYEAGVECVHCVHRLFRGSTPKYVLCDIDGMVKCPPIIPDPPNGSHILVQRPTLPCSWRKLIPGGHITWTIGALNSNLQIVEGIGWWFMSFSGAGCTDEFSNDLGCDNPAEFASGGSAKIYWGPQIGKESIT